MDLPAPPGGLPIDALVLSEPGTRAAAAHAWGFAWGRAAGPAPLRRLLEPALERTVVITSDACLAR